MKILIRTFFLFVLACAALQAQSVSIQRQSVVDWQGYNPSVTTIGNPASGYGRMYFNSVTGQMVCVTSTGGSCLSSGSGSGSAGLIDPTQSPYNAPLATYLAADGSTTNTLNTFSSASTNCNPANAPAGDVGNLAIVVNPATHTYPFGTGLVTVTGCSGNAWTLSATASATVAGTAVWAMGGDAGAGISTAYATSFGQNAKPGKIIAMPCGVLIFATIPFPNQGTVNVPIQRPDVNGCNSTGGTIGVFHPQVTSSILTNGGTFFFSGSSTNWSGTINPGGIGGNGKVSNLFLTSLGGNLPGTAGKGFSVITNFGIEQNIFMQLIGLAAGTGTAISSSSGEAKMEDLNLQNFSPADSWVGINMTGQGPNIVTNVICAFSGLFPCIEVTGAATGVVENAYITQTDGGIITAGGILTLIGSQLTGCSASAGAATNCLSDGGTAATWHLFANQIATTNSGNFCPINITSASTVVDISATSVTSVTSGYPVCGTAKLIDRGDDAFSSALTQFTGQYVPIGGGSMSTNTKTASTNFGANLTTQTISSAVLGSATLQVNVGFRQVTLGVGCGAGSNTVSGTLTWTSGGITQTASIPTLTISANGTVGNSGNYVTQPLHADVNTSITFVSSSTLVSTGCGTIPQYVADYSL